MMTRPRKRSEGTVLWGLQRGAILLLFAVLTPPGTSGQSGREIFSETFDTLVPPALPEGWVSTRLRNPLQGDWISSAASPRSQPNALAMTNATVAQALVSPPLSFKGEGAGMLTFALRRSASFVARVAIDASSDGGATFPLRIAEDLLPETDSRYLLFSFPLPALLNGAADARIRWSTSAAPSGTTGTLRLDDLAVTSIPLCDGAPCNLSCTPGHPREGDPLRATCLLVNAGAEPFGPCEVEFRWERRGGGNIPTVPARAVTVSGTVGVGDTSSAQAEIEAPGPGEYALIALLRVAGDTHRENDTARTLIRIGARPGRGKINEIMYAPSPGGTEWIEIVNTGSTPLDLAGWSVGDEGDSAGRPIAPGVPLLGSGEYALITADSALLRSCHASIPPGVSVSAPLPALNNTGDMIFLNDLDGVRIDSVRFSPDWHHPALAHPAGRSLERVSLLAPSSDRRSWGSSVDPSGSTPGRANSISCELSPSGAGLVALPNPFSPDDDGHDDRTAISYRTPAGSGTVTLRVFDAKGRFVRMVANNEPCAGEGSAFWDGLDEGRRRVRIGIYLLLLEIVSPEGERVWTAKGSVVVARRL
jgi:hypothetical protein